MCIIEIYISENGTFMKYYKIRDYYTQKNIMVITICDNYIPHYYSHGDFDKEGSVLRLSYSRLVIHIRRRLVIQDE